MVKLSAIASRAKRFGKAALETGLAVHHGVELKEALDAFGLAVSPHTTPLDYEGALRIVMRAKREGLNHFDLWLVLDGYVCDTLDDAVVQLRSMHATYEAPPR